MRQQGYQIRNLDNRAKTTHNTFTFDSKRYHSSLDIKVSFGGILIDEIVDITYAVQQNAMPLFGYNSYVYDEMAVGSRIVNGAFTINFQDVHYLLKMQNTLRAVTHDQLEVFKEEDLLLEPEFDLPEGERPLWNQQFSILLQYGQPYEIKNQLVFAQSALLTGVQITSVTQQHDVEGRPVMETYNFIARDVIYRDQNGEIYEEESGDVRVESFDTGELSIPRMDRVALRQQNHELWQALFYVEEDAEIEIIGIDAVIESRKMTLNKEAGSPSGLLWSTNGFKPADLANGPHLHCQFDVLYYDRSSHETRTAHFSENVAWKIENY